MSCSLFGRYRPALGPLTTGPLSASCPFFFLYAPNTAKRSVLYEVRNTHPPQRPPAILAPQHPTACLRSYSEWPSKSARRSGDNGLGSTLPRVVVVPGRPDGLGDRNNKGTWVRGDWVGPRRRHTYAGRAARRGTVTQRLVTMAVMWSGRRRRAVRGDAQIHEPAAGWIVLGPPPARPAGAAEAARYGDASELGCRVNRAHAGAGTGRGTHTRAVRPCEAPNTGTRGEAREGGWAGREEVSPRRPTQPVKADTRRGFQSTAGHSRTEHHRYGVGRGGRHGGCPLSRCDEVAGRAR